jgi:hypothetical protein
MGSETPFVIRLEVTVPRMLLPKLQPSLEQAGTSTVEQERISGQAEEMDEQEDSLLLLFQEPAPSQRQQPTIEVSSHAVHSLYFRLLQVVMPVTSRVFGLQILRGRNRFRSKYNHFTGKREGEALYVADEMAFSLEFRRSHAQEPASTSPLTPGLNQAVIYLDDEDTPVSYSIDGAES